MLPKAIDLVQDQQRASISMLQRRLRIGYSRAARLIDTMEEQGIIGPAPGGSSAREVLLPEPSDPRDLEARAISPSQDRPAAK
jgi:S-DNA-T family DNA segregation ATPase FtsK/SpoIIIE